MADAPSTPPTHSPPPNYNFGMLYYALAAVATAALVLTIYNFLLMKWCARRSSQPPRPPANGGSSSRTTETPRSFQLPTRSLPESSSFKYKKEAKNNSHVKNKVGNGDYDDECAVCLSVFEEGEEVRELQRCKHCFHAHCIDMWLYSHHDCPLCRAVVHVTTTHPPRPPPRREVEVGGEFTRGGG